MLSQKAWTRLGGCCTRVRRGPTRCPTRLPTSELFFFLLRFVLTWLDSRRFGFNSRRTEPYQPYWVVLAGDRNGRNKPKSALPLARTAEIPTSEAQKCVSCLLLSLFCESRHSNMFFKNILNNFLIAKSRCTCTLFFQKLPSPAPAPTPKSRNAPALHRCFLSTIAFFFRSINTC